MYRDFPLDFLSLMAICVLFKVDSINKPVRQELRRLFGTRKRRFCFGIMAKKGKRIRNVEGSHRLTCA